jgi:HSP20 family protein
MTSASIFIKHIDLSISIQSYIFFIMPSVTYMNQSAPFWDFIASLEQQGNNQSLFSQNRNDEAEQGRGAQQPREDAALFDLAGDLASWGSNFFGGQAFPHRGPPSRRHEQPCEQDNAETNEKASEADKGKNAEKNDEEMKAGNGNGEGPSGNSGSDNEGCAWGRGRHGRCGGGARRRGHCGPGGFAGPWGYSGPRHGGPHHEGRHGGTHGEHHGGPHHGPRGFGRRGGWGPWGRGGMGMFEGNGFDPSVLAAHFWDQFNETSSTPADQANKPAADNDDHTPDADVFDTESAFVVHISLPGAKKEDVAVNWDAEKSELSVAGVIYRPGDEEFLKTLAVGERKVGAFEKKIRLGTRASPAHIDADGISAKLEDGVLRVTVPKEDAEYVEIKKVDIE